MTNPLVFEPGCPFCAIAQGGDTRVEVIHQADDWLAFFPLDPATPGHTLVVPRTHVADLWGVEDSVAVELMNAVLRVGRAIQVGLKPEGMNLITSAGSIAEQTVFHLHLHIVPRWRQDGFGQIWPVEGKFEADELGNVAHLIREAF